jgi:hypothetical protein
MGATVERRVSPESAAISSATRGHGGPVMKRAFAATVASLLIGTAGFATARADTR